MQVELEIPRPYNGGEWRISRKVVGPRGGISWEKIISQPATGGTYRTRLDPGQYKQTTWSNGWPRSAQFAITSDGRELWDESE